MTGLKMEKAAIALVMGISQAGIAKEVQQHLPQPALLSAVMADELGLKTAMTDSPPMEEAAIPTALEKSQALNVLL